MSIPDLPEPTPEPLSPLYSPALGKPACKNCGSDENMLPYATMYGQPTDWMCNDCGVRTDALISHENPGRFTDPFKPELPPCPSCGTAAPDKVGTEAYFCPGCERRIALPWRYRRMMEQRRGSEHLEASTATDDTAWAELSASPTPSAIRTNGEVLRPEVQHPVASVLSENGPHHVGVDSPVVLGVDRDRDAGLDEVTHVASDIHASEVSRTSASTRAQDLREIAEWEKQNDTHDQSKVVHQFPDGWSVRQLATPNDHAREGWMMGNCVGDADWDYDQPNTPMAEPSGYHSLRDPDNLPHATWLASPRGDHYDARGRHNSPVKPKYQPYLDQFGVTYDKGNPCEICGKESMEGTDWCEACINSGKVSAWDPITNRSVPDLPEQPIPIAQRMKTYQPELDLPEAPSVNPPCNRCQGKVTFAGGIGGPDGVTHIYRCEGCGTTSTERHPPGTQPRLGKTAGPDLWSGWEEPLPPTMPQTLNAGDRVIVISGARRWQKGETGTVIGMKQMAAGQPWYQVNIQGQVIVIPQSCLQKMAIPTPQPQTLMAHSENFAHTSNGDTAQIGEQHVPQTQGTDGRAAQTLHRETQTESDESVRTDGGWHDSRSSYRSDVEGESVGVSDMPHFPLDLPSPPPTPPSPSRARMGLTTPYWYANRWDPLLNRSVPDLPEQPIQPQRYPNGEIDRRLLDTTETGSGKFTPLHPAPDHTQLSCQGCGQPPTSPTQIGTLSWSCRDASHNGPLLNYTPNWYRKALMHTMPSYGVQAAVDSSAWTSTVAKGTQGLTAGHVGAKEYAEDPLRNSLFLSDRGDPNAAQNRPTFPTTGPFPDGTPTEDTSGTISSDESLSPMQASEDPGRVPRHSGLVQGMSSSQGQAQDSRAEASQTSPQKTTNRSMDEWSQGSEPLHRLWEEVSSRTDAMGSLTGNRKTGQRGSDGSQRHEEEGRGRDQEMRTGLPMVSRQENGQSGPEQLGALNPAENCASSPSIRPTAAKGPRLDRTAAVWEHRIPFYMSPNGGYAMGIPGQHHEELDQEHEEPLYTQWWNENPQFSEEQPDGWDGDDQGHVIFDPTYGEIPQWPTGFEVSEEAKQRVLAEARSRYQKYGPADPNSTSENGPSYRYTRTGTLGPPEGQGTLGSHPEGPRGIRTAEESPRQFYHSVPKDDVQSVLQRGLDWNHRDQSRDWRDLDEDYDNYPVGNYVTDDLAKAHDYAKASGGVVYNVADDGREWHPDPDPQWEGRAFYSPHPIPPQLLSPLDRETILTRMRPRRVTPSTERPKSLRSAKRASRASSSRRR